MAGGGFGGCFPPEDCQQFWAYSADTAVFAMEVYVAAVTVLALLGLRFRAVAQLLGLLTAGLIAVATALHFMDADGASIGTALLVPGAFLLFLAGLIHVRETGHLTRSV